METSQLRRLRFIEGLVMNIPFLLVLMIVFVVPLYLRVSPRLIAGLLLMQVLASLIFSRSLRNLFYVRIFPFMKPLWDYDQQKSASDKWIKWSGRFFNALVVIGLIFVVIYPPSFPEHVDWLSLKYTIAGSLIGYNIGIVWKAFTEKFDY
ncbi:hypothetical protein [Desulfosporosinus meridiei]|uniref:Uncharacterized protein n=1 Tax=Desulfosporosinus meridiei (strain ATCC BAA-275 / DSM 13257 / KCTC 12902 / NCIMB 13706 / S10) TaxID=768704 RepID=J7INC3_DESMD|nr:hypothetical protein [Desulfosporosinus meridiei]AFQ43282.1 hypothetical protein Desmer_1268 [Desulfosporosinus meridiei DSM 13257]